MKLGERIKHRLEELPQGHDVKWLSKRSGVAETTLYELMNGRQKSTTKGPAIARALGLHAQWLHSESGPRLLTEDPETFSSWPFSVEIERLRVCSPAEIALIEAAMVGVLSVIEGRRARDGGQSGIDDR